MKTMLHNGTLAIHGTAPRQDEVLTPAALAFLVALHERFEPKRQAALEARRLQQQKFDRGEQPHFLPETEEVRTSAWRVPHAPHDLVDRRVEITGPVERKMMINALNSGANCFMADFEDSLSPTWSNCIAGQANLLDAVRDWLAFTSPEGKDYRVGPHPATLIVRPRGWHLPERHVTVQGKAISASLFDAGLFLFHNAVALVAKKSGPYLYLPKVEHHREARLWDEVLAFTEQQLALPIGTIRVTVLIETLPAAFQMDEILHELRARVCGLNAGRWDYLFSAIKTLAVAAPRDAVLPDRSAITMDVPFMAAYCRLLVQTCHKRGAHAMGGMAAFIPNRRDPVVTERALAKVDEDKRRESELGFDGTWVAHPDLVPVAKAIFDRHLAGRPNQLEQMPAGGVGAEELLDMRIPGGQVTEAGVRHNLRAALLYVSAWLHGTGAVAIDNLMEDAATAEISRAQLWHWLRHGTKLPDGTRIDQRFVERLLAEERQRAELEGATGIAGAERLVKALLFVPQMAGFLTLSAYEHLENQT